ncbi:type II toxin-antitoxin system Phd/YefM family antitoxin [candidate division KSB1 bacterium]
MSNKKGLHLDGVVGSQTFSIAEVRGCLSEVLDSVFYRGPDFGVRVHITKHGRPIAAVVCMGDIRFLEMLKDAGITNIEELKRRLNEAS